MTESSSSLDLPLSAERTDSSSSNACGKCGQASFSELLCSGEGQRPKSPGSVEDDCFWIQCDMCELWFHGKCVDVEEYEEVLLEHYHCPECTEKKGPSILKQVLNKHRYKFYDGDASERPPEIGTEVWLKEFKHDEGRIADCGDRLRVLENGHQLTVQWLKKTGWDKPVLVKNVEGLGIRVPDYSLDQVVEKLGTSRRVDVIDVQIQRSFRMSLGRFLELWHEKPRKRLYNLISLEVSRTEMSDEVKIPDVVEDISWVHTFWPRDPYGSSEVLHEHLELKPEVGKFCLVGMKDSFTDFHIDFGGSSVWYHVVRGKKIFYVIEPTDRNLAMFEEHGKDALRHEKFFGYELPAEECGRLEVGAGETLFIPAGWIHAVLTPVDSLVFGGNFLHSLHIPMQLRVAEMEERLNTDERFMFPNFKISCMYAAKHLTEVFHDANDGTTLLDTYLLEAAQSLIASLKNWVKLQKAAKRKADASALSNYGKAARGLQKEVSLQEKRKLEKKNKSSPNKPAGTSTAPESQRKKPGSHVPLKRRKKAERKKPAIKLKLKTQESFPDPPPLKLKLNLADAAGKEETVEEPLLSDSSASPTKGLSPEPHSDSPQTQGFRFCNFTPISTALYTESQEGVEEKAVVKPEVAELPVGFSLVKLQQESESPSPKGLSLLIKKTGAKPPISPIKIAREIDSVSAYKKAGAPAPVSSGLDISGIFGTSSHGRVQKPSKWVTGIREEGESTRKTTEYVAELGQHCLTDTDFVYPSLIDSDSEDGISPAKLRRRKSAEAPQPVFKIAETHNAAMESEEHLVIAENPKTAINRPPPKKEKSIKQKGVPKKKTGSTAKQRLATKMKLHRFNVPI